MVMMIMIMIMIMMERIHTQIDYAFDQVLSVILPPLPLYPNSNFANNNYSG